MKNKKDQLDLTRNNLTELKSNDLKKINAGEEIQESIWPPLRPDWLKGKN